MNAYRYEVRYESTSGSGTVLVLAGSPEEALAKFKAEWEEHGDEAPTAWIAGSWSTTN
jgi:hypothetical protein